MSKAHRTVLSLATPALAAFTLVGAGCAHNATAPQETTEESRPAKAAPEQKQQLQATAAPDNSQDKVAADDLNKALADLKNTRVFFAFNDDTLTAEAREKLSTIADILSHHSALKIRIEGNCDERGTEEYNLALGQRRAEASRRYLTNLGVQDNQIQTVSYGKERPANNGHDEEAWKQNRRDDVVTQTSSSNQ